MLAEQKPADAPASASRTDVSALSAMLSQKWKTGGGTEANPDAMRAGQVRSFRIISVDPAQKRIELELA
jgi:small subunit ribosomal protein S1